MATSALRSSLRCCSCVNGQDIRASQEDRYTTWLALATGELDETALAASQCERLEPAT